jgi:uncharacterized tellurite resistance protein B-like protein
MLAFIIFGTRGIRSTIKEGKFACPQCQTFTHYKHKKVTNFFTLYFIPLIPLGSKGTYVECQQCRNTFIERVLELSQVRTEQPKVQSQTQPRIQENEKPLVGVTKNLDEKSGPVEFLSEKQKAIKKLLILMILADGKVENEEIAAFHKIYKNTTGLVVNNIYYEIEQVKTENKSARQYLKEVAHLLNDEGKIEIIQSGMMIAAADGNVDPTELNMLATFGKALGLNNTQVKEIIGA